MAELKDVIEQLQVNNETSIDTNKNLSKLVDKLTGGDSLEDRLKKSRGKQSSTGLVDNINEKGLLKGTGTSLLSGITGIFATIGGYVTKFINVFKKVGGFIAKFGKLASRLFLPLTLAIGAISGIVAGWKDFTEGNYWEGTEKTITGFFNSIVGIPLDLIKDGISWLLKKMGFSETAAILDSFKFTEEFEKIISSLFAGVKESVKVVTDLFKFEEEDKTALGLLGKLTDLVYAPVNMAIGFVKGLFGFEKTDEPFKLQDWISNKALEGIAWVKGLFTWAGETIATGWTNLTDYISGVWDDIDTWFTDKFTWAGFTIAKGWTNLTDYVDIKWKSILRWFTEKFEWAKADLAKDWTNLTTFVGAKWQQVVDFIDEKLGIDISQLPNLDLKATLKNTYENVKNNFMSSMEDLAIWFTTMPKKIGLSLEEEWVYAVQKLKVGFVKFGDWIAGLPDSIFLGSLTKLKETVPDWASKALGLDGAIIKAQARLDARESGTDASLERIDYSTAKSLGEINQKRRELDTFAQSLIDAKQYTTTTMNGSVVLQQDTPTADPLNGGSAYDFIGAR